MPFIVNTSPAPASERRSTATTAEQKVWVSKRLQLYSLGICISMQPQRDKATQRNDIDTLMLSDRLRVYLVTELSGVHSKLPSIIRSCLSFIRNWRHDWRHGGDARLCWQRILRWWRLTSCRHHFQPNYRRNRILICELQTNIYIHFIYYYYYHMCMGCGAGSKK